MESYDCGFWANFLGGLFATAWSTALFITLVMLLIMLILCSPQPQPHQADECLCPAQS